MITSQQLDYLVAGYIQSLWGKKRRQWAYAYWMHLTRDQPFPTRETDEPLPFRGTYIVERLLEFKTQLPGADLE